MKIKKIIAAGAAAAIALAALPTLSVSADDGRKLLFITDLTEAQLGNTAIDLAEGLGLGAEVYTVDTSDGNFVDLQNNAELTTKISKASAVTVMIGESTFAEPVIKTGLFEGYTDMHKALNDFSESDLKGTGISSKIQAALLLAMDEIEDAVYAVNKNSDLPVYVCTVYNPLSIDISSSEWSFDEGLKISTLEAYSAPYLTELNDFIKEDLRNTKVYDNVQVVDIASDFAGWSEYLTNITKCDYGLSKSGQLAAAAKFAIAQRPDMRTGYTILKDYGALSTKERDFLDKNKNLGTIVYNGLLAGKCGDTNDNGSVTSEDATKILVDYADALVNDKTIRVYDYPYGDVNRDNKISSEDATVILIEYAKALVDDKTISYVEIK